jgi:hypothetical protein
MEYSQYASLPDEERKRVGHPIFTLAWFDPEEIVKLSKQSWLTQLRDQLNRGGKITLSLGVFKYEQTGVNERNQTLSATEFAQELFQKTTPLTVSSFQKLLDESIRKAEDRFFEPSLIVVDGELELPMSMSFTIDALFKLIATRLGYSISGNLARQIMLHPWCESVHNQLYSLAGLIEGGISLDYLKRCFEPPRDAAITAFAGKDYAKAFVFGVDAGGKRVRSSASICQQIRWVRF